MRQRACRRCEPLPAAAAAAVVPPEEGQQRMPAAQSAWLQLLPCLSTALYHGFQVQRHATVRAAAPFSGARHHLPTAHAEFGNQAALQALPEAQQFHFLHEKLYLPLDEVVGRHKVSPLTLTGGAPVHATAQCMPRRCTMCRPAMAM